MTYSLAEPTTRQQLSLASPNARWSQVARLPDYPWTAESAVEDVLPFRVSTSLLTRQPTSLNHHPSHLHLLSPFPAKVELAPSVDAIIVPSARPAPYLRNAVSLASEIGCPVLALCSAHATAEAAVKVADEADVEMIAIDVSGRRTALPDFATSAVVQETLFATRTDTAFKRNLGLVIGRMAGWERVTFLDDDLMVSAHDLRYSAELLDSYACVGFASAGSPDNSVVCHAYRDAGGEQDSFIGAGALSVSTSQMRSFFPNIYNSDWFFLLDQDELYPAAMTGQVHRAPYDPYRNTTRARMEEFGEDLAEGIFWLLDERDTVRAASGQFWTSFLTKRRLFIDEVMDMVHDTPLDTATRARMIEVLKASRGRSWVIHPQLCADYLEAWRWDSKRWRRFLDKLPVRPTLEVIMTRLGLAGAVRFSQHLNPRRPLWYI